MLDAKSCVDNSSDVIFAAIKKNILEPERSTNQTIFQSEKRERDQRAVGWLTLKDDIENDENRLILTALDFAIDT